MRNFTRFMRDEKNARLDIHCYKLDKKECEELFKILKNMGFTFCYMRSDSILALLTGSYSHIKNIMKRLEKRYGFAWTKDPAIIGKREKKGKRR